jgi:transposase-like protein
MDTSPINLPSPGRRRGRYSEAFKRQIVVACEAPGVSTAAIALANGLNANLVRRWVALARGEEAAGSPLALPPNVTGTHKPTPAFVSLPVPPSASASSPAAEIRLELRSGTQVLTLYWPLSAASQCLQALKDWAR